MRSKVYFGVSVMVLLRAGTQFSRVSDEAVSVAEDTGVDVCFQHRDMLWQLAGNEYGSAFHHDTGVVFCVSPRFTFGSLPIEPASVHS